MLAAALLWATVLLTLLSRTTLVSLCSFSSCAWGFPGSATFLFLTFWLLSLVSAKEIQEITSSFFHHLVQWCWIHSTMASQGFMSQWSQGFLPRKGDLGRRQAVSIWSRNRCWAYSILFSISPQGSFLVPPYVDQPSRWNLLEVSRSLPSSSVLRQDPVHLNPSRVTSLAQNEPLLSPLSLTAFSSMLCLDLNVTALRTFPNSL
jgi:hypothetical protein